MLSNYDDGDGIGGMRTPAGGVPASGSQTSCWKRFVQCLWNDGLHHQAAGDFNDLTGDIASIVRAEERNHACDFFRLTVTTHCNQSQHFIPLFIGESVCHRGLDKARSDSVDGDASRTEFLRSGLCHADDGSLGSRIIHLSRIAIQTGNGCQADDSAMTMLHMML